MRTPCIRTSRGVTLLIQNAPRSLPLRNREAVLYILIHLPRSAQEDGISALLVFFHVNLSKDIERYISTYCHPEPTGDDEEDRHISSSTNGD